MPSLTNFPITAVEGTIDTPTQQALAAAVSAGGLVPDGATARRTLSSFMADRLNVLNLGVKGDGTTDDRVALQAAVALMASLSKRLWFPPGRTYIISDYITVSGGFFEIESEGAVIQRQASSYISSTTTPDTTQPTASAPGHLSGGAFYFTSLMYNSRVDGFTFVNFKIPLVWFTAHNSPTVTRCTFIGCNAWAIFYQGSQNLRLFGCSTGAGCNVGVIAMATCFPVGSALAGQDNYYADGTNIDQAESYGSGAFAINAAFDTWFVASILRPSVASATAANPSGIQYLDQNGTLYADTDPMCLPSGRMLFKPVRNPRQVFDLQIGYDCRGGAPRGLALVNGAVSGFHLKELFAEGFTGTAAIITLGAIQFGMVAARVDGNVAAHPTVVFTGRGYSSGQYGFDERLFYAGQAPQIQAKGTRYLFAAGGAMRSDRKVTNLLSMPQPVPVNTAVGLAPGIITYGDRGSGHGSLLLPFDPITFGELLGDGSDTAADATDMDFYVGGGGPLAFDFPAKCADGYFRANGYVSPLGYVLAGIMRTRVWNADSQLADYAEHTIQFGTASSATVNWTAALASAAAAGDQYFTLTSAPPRTMKMAKITVGSATYSIDRFDPATSRLYVVGGIRTAASSGATVTCPQFCTVRKAFSQSSPWINVGIGVVGYAPNSLGFISNLSSADGAAVPDGSNLRVFIDLISMPLD